MDCLHESIAVTLWIERARCGDERAADTLFHRYFEKLVSVARHKLQTRRLPGRTSDEEDIALSALNCFLAGVRTGRFPDLRDRECLWRLLLVIATNKIRDKADRDFAQKRGAGRALDEAALRRGDDGDSPSPWDDVLSREPSPDMAATVADELDALLRRLSPELQQVAQMKLEGYTHREIAARLQTHEKRIEYKLNRIRQTWSANEMAVS